MKWTDKRALFNVPLLTLLKKSALYFMPAFISVGLILFILHSRKADGNLNLKKNSEQFHIDIVSANITHKLQEIVIDLNILSSHYELDAFLKNSNQVHLKALNKEFLTFSKSKSFYDQIRLIDQSGREIIRINAIDGQSVTVSPEDLQDKSARYYVEKIMTLKQGEVYISPMDLNIERGQVEIPRKPMIRIGKPIFDDQGQIKGIILLNIMIEEIFQEVEGHSSFEQTAEYWVFGSDYFWIHNPIGEESWQFIYQEIGGSVLKKNHPNLLEEIWSTNKGQLISEAGLVTFTMIDPRLGLDKSGLEPNRTKSTENKGSALETIHWKIVSVLPKEILYAGSTDDLQKSLLYLFLICPFIGIASVKLAKGEQKLVDSEVSMRAIFDQSSDSIILINPENGRFITFNEKAHQSLGYTHQEFEDLAITDIEISKDKAQVKKHMETIKRKGLDTFQTQHRTKTGKLRDVRVKTNIISINKKPYFLMVLHDITERREADEFHRLSTAVFNNATEGIMIANRDRNILTINPAFTKITGYSAKEMIGKNPRVLQSGRHNKTFYQKMWKNINTTGHWQGEIWNRKKNGEVYPEWLSITAVKDEKGNVLHYTGIFSDITRRKLDEERLQHQVHSVTSG